MILDALAIFQILIIIAAILFAIICYRWNKRVVLRADPLGERVKFKNTECDNWIKGIITELYQNDIYHIAGDDNQSYGRNISDLKPIYFEL